MSAARRQMMAGNQLGRKYPKEYDCASRLYRCWRAMFLRHRKSHAAYERYKDKPICEEWNDYRTFMNWAIAAGYRDTLQIDRIDNNKGYSPENCRWVTASQNGRNKSTSLPPLAAFGESKTPIEWSEDGRCVVTYALLMKRLYAGWPLEIALSTPSQAKLGGKYAVGFASGGLRPKGSRAEKKWRGAMDLVAE